MGQLISSYPINAGDNPESSVYKLGLTGLPTGIYQLHFEGDGKAEAIKFFKQ